MNGEEPRRADGATRRSSDTGNGHDAGGVPANAEVRVGRHGAKLRGLDKATDAPESRFGRMFSHLAARGDVEPRPEELGLPGGPMDAGTERSQNPDVFAVMTYFGQFIAHDMSFDPTSSLEQQQDPDAIRNFRTPALELDSLYGAGPAASPSLYDQLQPNKLLLGKASHGTEDVDLPRNAQGVALIGDPRNDENLIISQLHVAFIKFHNAIVDRLSSIDDGIDDTSPFEKAQRLVRWHYQWLVLKEFLPVIVGDVTIQDILNNGRVLYRQANFIPVEFSVAAYRFGHSMAQPAYVINDDFTAPLFPSSPDGTPGGEQRRSDLRGGPIRFEERIDWKNFVDTGKPPSPKASRFSSKIDTQLSPPLLNLPRSVIPGDVPQELRSLAVRNLRRGVSLRLPSGQAVAKEVARRIPQLEKFVMSDKFLWGNPKAKAFEGTFAPLWYYFLREAEYYENGRALGPIGGRIVAEVLIGLLDMDPRSFLRVKPDWRSPLLDQAGPAKFAFPDFFRLAGVLT